MMLALAIVIETMTVPSAHAAVVRLAVASNFAAPLKALIADYRTRATQGDSATTLAPDLRVSLGSTGQLFAQIAQGAPFDVYLAADQARPAQAVRDGHAIAGTTFTYAIGRLVLIQRGRADAAAARADADQGSDSVARLKHALTDEPAQRLAIANPRTAPYGAAALEALTQLGLVATYRPRLVFGQNVMQAFQFAMTGSMDAAIVARATVVAFPPGDVWQETDVPRTLHAPIAQDAVLLTRAADNDAARRFLSYLASPDARRVIARAGFDLPET
ncbi:MAG: molybdate ABC transporter substrate-binding protein [Pseudomonadota bacterium]